MREFLSIQTVMLKVDGGRFHGEWNYTISPISAKHSSIQPSPSLSKYTKDD